MDTVQFQHTATRRWLRHTIRRPWILFSFNTQPPEGGCWLISAIYYSTIVFQHTATRRWLHSPISGFRHGLARFNTQPPEGGCTLQVAGKRRHCCFNTQPPEGGCLLRLFLQIAFARFQHTATRRWLPSGCSHDLSYYWFQHTATRRWLRLPSTSGGVFAIVSTHSHPKVAASRRFFSRKQSTVSTHSHPKVAALGFGFFGHGRHVSTHSHPKVAACGSQNPD